MVVTYWQSLVLCSPCSQMSSRCAVCEGISFARANNREAIGADVMNE